MPDSTALMGEAEVDVVPRLIAPGPQVYPAELKQLGISGRVVVTYVIDREGRMMPPSLRVVEASDPAFVRSTAEMLRTSRFSPAAHLGAPVAVCVQQSVNFTVT
jgi:TonB family protein